MGNEKTFDFDDEHGREYSQRIARSLPGYEDLYRMTAEFFAVHLDDSAHILVTGAGGGKELCVLAGKNRSWKLTGVDPSAQMIGLAKARMAKQGVDAELHTGQIDELAKNRVYSAATSLLVLHFLPDDAKKTYLSSIASLLAPSAPFALAAVVEPPPTPLLESFDQAWFNFMVNNGIDKEFVEERFVKAKTEISEITEEKTVQLVRECGFDEPIRFFTGFRFTGWFTRRTA